MADSRHIVYLLQSISNPRRTYVGYTVNLAHRLRQHNGEIVGGAKATRSARPWKIIGYLTGFPTASAALQFEWRIHHPWINHKKKRVSGLISRVQVWSEILNLDKWSQYSLTMNWMAQWRLTHCPSNVVEIFMEDVE